MLMDVAIRCPECGKETDFVTEELITKRTIIECPHCFTAFVIKEVHLVLHEISVRTDDQMSLFREERPN